MKSVLNFIVKPLNNNRYNNKKKVSDKELILNTEIFSHQHVNRYAEVIAVPSVGDTDIQVGDTVIVHHNVFRRFNDMRGEEKDSKSYYKDDMYFVFPDQIFLYKHKDNWKANEGFCFVKPIESKSNDIFFDFSKMKIFLATFFLCTALKTEEPIKDSLKINNNTYWGGNIDEIFRLIKAKKIDETNIKFFIGYSGWEHNQLEDEIENKNWIVRNNKSGEILNINNQKHWKLEMKRLGGEYLLWSESPENPASN